MGFNADEEILQDFLLEAGEILESLSEQLVELENRPDDSNLLNSIFRGFHTVKGGAGFLQLDPLVDLCHAAENTFDCLRNDKIQVTTGLMDVVLQALDSVNDMFESVHRRVMPEPASAALIDAINRFANGEDISDFVAQSDLSESGTSSVSADAPVEPSLEPVISPSSNGNNEITDDEFEALLDQLHGAGQGPTVDAAKVSTKQSINNVEPSGDIGDDEFEALLDSIHGAGKGPTAALNASKVTQVETD